MKNISLKIGLTCISILAVAVASAQIIPPPPPPPPPPPGVPLDGGVLLMLAGSLGYGAWKKFKGEPESATV
ncbi:MAG: hypothetical protein U0T73_10835 [Chitinophagales bacterium]